MSALGHALADLRKAKPARPRTAPPDVAHRQVRLKAVYLDFWSTTKMGFLLGATTGLLGVVITYIAWVILNQAGAFQQVGQLLGSVTGSQGSNSLTQALSLGPVMTFALVMALLNIVVLTVTGAVAAGIFNLSSRLTGGFFLGFRSK